VILVTHSVSSMAGTPARPALLVPIAVDALVLTELAINDQAWSWNTPNYSLIRFFQPPTQILQSTPPAPKTPSGSAGRTGTVLRWALPDGLTSAGTADDASGTLTFPPVPNRWLVLRRVADTPTATSAWILASDFVGGTGTSFPVGNTPTTLGMCWELSAWPGEAALAPGLQPPLTALGPGNPSFAAYVPNVQHVLAFHDPLTGVSPAALSYLLIGWYAGHAPDPLEAVGWQTADDWAALMSSLGWSVGADLSVATSAAGDWAAAHGQMTDPDDPHTILPSRTVCHGMLSAVAWPGADGASPSGVPVVTPGDPATLPVLTIAHTPADALAAVVATAAGQQSTQVAEAVTALLADLLPLLDEPDGADQLAMTLQGTWFQQLPGGTGWRVNEPEQEAAPTGHAATPLSDAQERLLDSLNDAQAGLDEHARQLSAQQWEIYALWWKLQLVTRLAENPIPNAQQTIQTAFDAKSAQTTQAITDWRNAQDARDAAQRALSAQLGDLVLLPVPEPLFWRPSDPLVMIQGVGRSYAHGEDGRYTEDGSLYCRFTGQTISRLQVSGTATTVTADTLTLRPIAANDGPPELNDLAVEAYFLDPSNATAIAAAADPAHPQPSGVVAAQQTLVWNTLSDLPLDQQTLAEAAGLDSEYGPVAVPSKIGVNYWSAPWVPLFLDWSVTYYPTGAAQTGWAFPAPNPSDPLEAQTAQWTGTQPQTSASIQGRTLLTPQATDALAARLTQLVSQFGTTPEVQPYLSDLNDAIDYLRDACVLSQTLSGFTDLLLQRDPTLFLQPDLSTLGQWLAPPGAPAYNPSTGPSPDSVVPFSPVAGGFVAFHQLWVIDAFGQRYDVLTTLRNNPSTQGQPLGPDLRPSIASGLIPLRPRLAQASRLLVNFLDGREDALVVGRSTEANPLCGWLIPNRLDNGILVYDAVGVLQGELVVERNTALWLPAPDETAPSSQNAAPVLANLHLADVVNGVLSSTNSGGALLDLIGTIQEASWAIAPSGPAADQLSTLVGFPVAVARAQLLLELSGPPATSQLWSATGHGDNGGVTDATFVVQLGSTELYDDGLIGALLDDDPAHLLSPYGASPNGYVVTGTHGVAVNQPLNLTVLLHPQSKVHAFSGILPPVAAALPPSCQVVPLTAMEVTFRSGPVLTPATGISLPLPAAGRGDWSWLQYVTPSAPARPRPVSAADPTAQLLDAAPTMRDGWLRLTLAGQPTMLTYALTPVAVPAGTGARPTAATVILTAYNGSGATVSCSSIQITLPVGTDASGLTSDPDRIVASSSQPDAWTLRPAGATQPGVFVAQSIDSTATVDPGVTLTFVFTNIDVAPGPGVVLVGIDELGASAPAHVDLTLEKVPTS
jgi:hypothetical protein